MIKVIIFTLALGLSGCGMWDRAKANVQGVVESCHGGVMYLQFFSGVTPAYKPDGTLRTCP